MVRGRRDSPGRTYHKLHVGPGRIKRARGKELKPRFRKVLMQGKIMNMNLQEPGKIMAKMKTPPISKAEAFEILKEQYIWDGLSEENAIAKANRVLRNQYDPEKEKMEREK